MKTILLTDFPENMPLYKDSGLWQMRSDDMEEVIVQQQVNESDEDFILRCKDDSYKPRVLAVKAESEQQEEWLLKQFRDFFTFHNEVNKDWKGIDEMFYKWYNTSSASPVPLSKNDDKVSHLLEVLREVTKTSEDLMEHCIDRNYLDAEDLTDGQKEWNSAIKKAHDILQNDKPLSKLGDNDRGGK
jgi:hypothetical protein